MAILVGCRACGGKFKAADHLAGRRAKCKCGAALHIPTPQPVPELASLADVATPVPQALHLEAALCPGCCAEMATDALICTACGFNRRTGQRMSVAIDPEEPADQPSPRKSRATRPLRSTRDTPERAPVGPLLWRATKILCVAAVIYSTVHFVRAALSFDPGAQARAAHKSVSAGMSVAQVVKLMGSRPKEVWTIQETPFVGGLPSLAKDVRIPYYDDFMKHYPIEKVPDGFRFIYKFSQRDNLLIHFSPTGFVNTTEMVDPMKSLGM